MSMIEIGILIALVMITGVMIVSYILSLSLKHKLNQKITTKGMNGLEGTKINLTCPSGQVISFKNTNKVLTRGALIASGALVTLGSENTVADSRCDAFWQPPTSTSSGGQSSSFFNPQTTIDMLGDKSPFTQVKDCEGKENCSFVVPTKEQIPKSGPGSCMGTTAGKLAFIGTYDCIAKNS